MYIYNIIYICIDVHSILLSPSVAFAKLQSQSGRIANPFACLQRHRDNMALKGWEFNIGACLRDSLPKLQTY
jgi:hypothetical protein